MRRRIYDIPPTETKELFTYLERLGVRTTLDDYSRHQATVWIDSLIDQVSDWRKSGIVSMVASAILLELRKSKQIDEDFIRYIMQVYPNIRGPPPKEKKVTLWSDSSESEDEDEEEEEEEEDVVDVHSDTDDDDDFYKVKIDWKEREKLKLKQKEAAEQATEQDMKELKDVCRKWGCTLKQGHEQKILKLVIPFLSANFNRFSCSELDRRICIELFMEYHVVDYVDCACTLNDLETVDRAINSVKKAIEERDNRDKEQHKGYSRLISPTNEEGVTTPMNQFNQEKSEKLAEQKEICLTAFVNEQTKEYGNVVTPLKQEEEEKSTVDIDVCLAPECKDMEIEKPRKRKLEFSVKEETVDRAISTVKKAIEEGDNRDKEQQKGYSRLVNSRVSVMFAETQDKCVACRKTVYPIEKVGVVGTSYHKACFRCTHGGCVISPSNYVAHEHRLYCKYHHNQLFKQKGNVSQLDKHDEAEEVTENTVAE